MQIWIWKSSNARTVRNGDMWLFHAKVKGQSVSSVMDHIRLNITVNLLSIIRLTSRPTYWGSKQNRANCALTHSNVWTARANIKSVWTCTLSGNIISIGNGTPRNTKNFEILRDNQLAQSWVAFKHDYQKYQNIFTKYS